MIEDDSTKLARFRAWLETLTDSDVFRVDDFCAKVDRVLDLGETSPCVKPCEICGSEEHRIMVRDHLKNRVLQNGVYVPFLGYVICENHGLQERLRCFSCRTPLWYQPNLKTEEKWSWHDDANTTLTYCLCGLKLPVNKNDEERILKEVSQIWQKACQGVVLTREEASMTQSWFKRIQARSDYPVTDEEEALIKKLSCV